MTSFSNFTKTEYNLLKFLRLSLRKSRPGAAGALPTLSAKEWHQLLDTADRHEVLSLFSNMPQTQVGQMPVEQRDIIQSKTAKVVHTGIMLQALNAKLTLLLESEGITAVTLKGCTVSRLYPVPEFRKTSDIDLFVADSAEAERAVKVLCANGFRLSGEWHANHHFVLISEKNEVVELHTTWTECFKEKYLNQYLDKLYKESVRHCQMIDVQGFTVYAYEMAWQALYLMFHMLQHFVGSGFGLRNLCDWVILWEHCDDAKVRKDFWKMVCESGTEKFTAAVTAICIKYLGLSKAKSPVPVKNLPEPDIADTLLRDVLDAGEFGYSESERMVGMDGDSLTAYVREFHHQMHINFPKAGNVILLWPVLWLATLVRFLKNNKKLNRAPVTAIIKKAGKRGRLVKRLMSR